MSEQHAPSDDQVRGRYCDGTYLQTGRTIEGDDFDAWLARVRRDAAREALDGLAVTYRDVSTLGILQYRDTHYPEETP